MKLFTLTCLFACFVLISCEKVRFDNYRVYSVKIMNEKQLEVLQLLENSPNGLFYIEAPISIFKTAEIVVAPHRFADIVEFFDEYQLKNEIKVENLQKLIDDEQPKITPRGTFGWEKYYNLEDIYSWLDQQLNQYPDILTNYDYGKSYENRTLRAVKLSHKEGNPTIFIEATIHAREWITVATATYILNEFLSSDDAEIKELVQNYDWIFVPVTNVDGYSYTHSNNRMWRKTRQPFGSQCIGADPNRNFDFYHSAAGSSTNPCSETYAGDKPFSEPEILSLSEFIKTFHSLKLYISFHSYSQLLLFPYGYTYKHAHNHNDMLEIGRKTIQAIAKRYGTSYVTGNIAETIYLVSGSSIDWVYATQNVSLTFSFEFRDKGQHGFILPSDQIIPNSLEVLDGLKVLVKEAKSLKYL